MYVVETAPKLFHGVFAIPGKHIFFPLCHNTYHAFSQTEYLLPFLKNQPFPQLESYLLREDSPQSTNGNTYCNDINLPTNSPNSDPLLSPHPSSLLHLPSL